MGGAALYRISYREPRERAICLKPTVREAAASQTHLILLEVVIKESRIAGKVLNKLKNDCRGFAHQLRNFERRQTQDDQIH